MAFRIEENKEGCTFEVRVAPRASANRMVGTLGNAIKIRIAASPVQGAANKALVEFLARRLGVRSHDVEILTGHTSRTKRVRIFGVTAEEVESNLLP